MNNLRKLLLPTTLAFMSLAHAAQSQVVLLGAHVITGPICIGSDCALIGEVFGEEDMKIRDNNPELLFDDTSSSSFADRDWRFRANEVDGTLEFFALIDEGTGNSVFKIEGASRPNAVYVDASGNVGFGTALPQYNLDIRSGDTPQIGLVQDASGGNDPQTWRIGGNDSGFHIEDVTSGTLPLGIAPGAPNNAIYISQTGEIGMGTTTPSGAFDIMRNDGTAALSITETNGIQTARNLLNLQNFGRPDIIMANTATGGEWSFGAGNNFVLKRGAVGSTDAEKTLHLKLFGATGNLEITGQIITGGGTCGGGCDRVFTERAIIPQAEYRAAMWENGYLPHVGPTKEGAPINVSEKLGGMLNSLEHAHIYIEAQDREIASLRAELARLAATIAEK